MIDEKELIRTLHKWKANKSKFAGLKEEALIDKVIAEVTNMSIQNRISIADIVEAAKYDMCINYYSRAKECQESNFTIRCPLDLM